MKQLIANPAGHIIDYIDGKRMLVDTGAARSYYHEYNGVRVDDLSRLFGVPLDGVMGMDSLQGKVVSLTRDTAHFSDAVPEHSGQAVYYISGIPCVDIKINEIPCRAAITTGLTTTYISEQLLSKDKLTGVVDDVHPLYGAFKVNMFVNYFSISNKSYFAEAGELPAEFSLLSSSAIDAIIGTDLLNRFNLILDFADDRLHLISR